MTRRNIMLSAAGRRVALMRLLKESLTNVDPEAQVIATDITRTSSAVQLADLALVVLPYEDPECLSFLLRLCEDHDIGLIVPTIDPDLTFYSKFKDQFEAIGTRINISSEETIAVANDKWSTHRWLVEQGFPTIRQADADDLLSGRVSWEFPLFAKPRRGSASIGAGFVNTKEQLRILVTQTEYIVQTIAKGREYTVDVFVNAEGVCQCAVPRMRLETRAGEVSKAITRRCQSVCNLATEIAVTLPGAYGVLNIQIMHDDSTGDLNVIEINPRFGGGYPLTHAAGAPMTTWLIEEAFGLPCMARSDGWRESVMMLRFDDAVFITVDDAGAESAR